ncbi:centrosomal protein of 162 kDa isoform X2 [Oncorhynchus mykiss]|uniref:centrosomal protein of 162 kDa isoform X2 n=1 Tax=Oncorhynchus mykiss TaxID=8022 RepID=UPI001878015D|nr:centrosomal protein of 162 kDa isoform X2 [Oncorhynchus mykiss]
MAHRLTKDELDEQFEQFLKESVSDDSVDLGGSAMRSSVLDSLGKASQKPPPKKTSAAPVPWWQEDDSEETPGREAAKRRFTKPKKPQQQAVVKTQEDESESSPMKSTPQAVTVEGPTRPTPKPRSKALDRLSQLDLVPGANQDASSHIAAGLENNSPEHDSSHSARQGSPPMNESSRNASGERSPEESTSLRDTPVDSHSSDSDSQSLEEGLLRSEKTFCKSLRRSQPIQEEEEELQHQGVERGSEEEEGAEPVIFSRDSLEPEDSVMASGPGQNAAVGLGLGMDSLEEEEEKARFFAHLEGGASSTIDYSRLNKDLDSTSASTTATTLRKAEAAVAGVDQRAEERAMESDRLSPASPHYSEDEDFEDEVIEEEPKRPAMLTKVSLHDSLDSTGELLPPGADSDTNEEPGRNQGAESIETALPAQSYGQSGASEMEALQEAYRQISGSLEDSDHHHHPSSPVRRERRRKSNPVPVSPSVPELSRGTLLAPVSTTESELPTAEELMRPIRPDSIDDTRGFTLQPASGTQFTPEKTGQSLCHRSRKSSPRRSAEPDTPPASPGPCPRSIREEVQRLMKQDQDSSSPDLTSTNPSNKRSQQVPGRSTVAGPFTSSLRKPYVAPGRGRVESKPSAVATRTSGARKSGPTRPVAVAKPPSPLTQRKPLSQTTYQSLSPLLSETDKDCGGLRVSSELVAGVQSFAAFLQQQHRMETRGRQDTSHTVSWETKGQQEASQTQTECPSERKSEPREEGRSGEVEESPLVSSLRLQLAQRERELHTREEELLLQYDTEVSSLRQENYLLQSKLHSTEEANSRKKGRLGRGLDGPLDPLTEDKLRLIEKEVKEQETIIQGYQQENEKLYLQMKALQAQSKLNEEAMFTENQRLLNELALTKEQMSNSPRTVGNVGCVAHIQRITELLGQMQAAQRTEERLVEETHRLKQEKQALEVDLEMMRKERDLAKAQVVYTSGDKSFELQVAKDRHKEEVCVLKKRLQWYAENQELLDRDSARLRAATADTHKLTEQVEKLKMEVGKRANQNKTKERAGDAKRIQDLERQVKEMEKILRQRNPNSLPALIYAAANAPAVDEDGGAKSSPPTQTRALLERRIQRLEAELESRDDEAKRSLRAMEQQYQRIKLQYEQQISDLEQRLTQKHPVQTGSPGVWQAQVCSLQQELELLKENHQSRGRTLQAEVHSLQEQLTQQAQSTTEPERAPQRSPSRHQRQAETALGVRIERLNQELSAKTRSVQELSRTVERLQRERKTMLCGPGPRSEGRVGPGEARRQAAGSKGPMVVATPGERGGTVGETATFPPTQDEKDYQPTAFSGSHISEVLQESEGLRLRLEQLELQRDKERVVLQAAAEQAQAELRRVQQHSAEQVSSLRADHQRELESLLTGHALAHSSSKVAELTNQVTAQEIMVQHLRDQVKELQGTKDALAVSKLREDTLQNQLTRLLEELKQAKECHSPELRHFTSLERKIHSMELRHTQREKELQQVIGQTQLVVEAEQQSEVERWRRLAQGKTRELEVFRLELDSILDVLRELQRQGVVIPAPDQASAVPFSWRT